MVLSHHRVRLRGPHRHEPLSLCRLLHPTDRRRGCRTVSIAGATKPARLRNLKNDRGRAGFRPLRALRYRRIAEEKMADTVDSETTNHPDSTTKNGFRPCPSIGNCMAIISTTRISLKRTSAPVSRRFGRLWSALSIWDSVSPPCLISVKESCRRIPPTAKAPSSRYLNDDHRSKSLK